ncbi:MAG: hypothetical protein IJ681_06830 [Bacteroidales bacterium]|nr:hypothetical protein [Bacteroidales bacterium]
MENSKYIRILKIIFNFEIANWEVVPFRGAILEALKQQGNLYFHNHIDDVQYRYSYPLIQYKRLSYNKACIVCVEQGCDVIGQLLQKDEMSLQIGSRIVIGKVEKILPNRIFMQIWNSEFHYRIKRWLPLNSENYEKYNNIVDLKEKIEFLEKILKGNLLSMCKGLNIYLSRELEVCINNLSRPFLVTNKGIKLMAFNIEFTSNLSIPNYIGIGKNASIGYGTIMEQKNIKDE